MPSEQQKQHQHFRVLTFNTASFNDGPYWCSTLTDDETGLPFWNFRDRQRNIIQKMILEQNPHVVCLQESVIKPNANDPRLALMMINEDAKNKKKKKNKKNMKRINNATDPYTCEGNDDFVSNSSNSENYDDDDDDFGLLPNRTALIDQEEVETAFSLDDAPPAISLDDTNNNNNNNNTIRKTEQEQQHQQLQHPLPGYQFIGQTQTHADFTNLWIREDLQVVKIDSVGGERGGDQYNFPVAVVRLSSPAPKQNSNNDNTNNDDNSRDDDDDAHDNHLIAVTSVHFTPFSSGGGGKRGKETRRENQLRKTVHGCYRAIHDAIMQEQRQKQDRCAPNFIKFSIIVAGDTNMRNEEFYCAKEALSLIDCHDYLRETLPSNCQTKDGIFSSLLLKNKPEHQTAVDDDCANSNSNAEDEQQQEQLWTWDTIDNRFNGQGPEYCARYDRIYFRSFECAVAPSSSPNDNPHQNQIELLLQDLMQSAIASRPPQQKHQQQQNENQEFCTPPRQNTTTTTTTTTSGNDDGDDDDRDLCSHGAPANHEGNDYVREALQEIENRKHHHQKPNTKNHNDDNHHGLFSSPPLLLLEPTSLALFGHKPIFDAEIDQIDRRTLEEYTAKKSSQRNVTSSKSSAKTGAGGWVSVFREDNDDDDENDDTSKTCLVSALDGVGANDAASIDKPAMLLAKNTKFDEMLFELAMNEHTNSMPPPEGRRRFLSDHFGLVVDFKIW